MDTNTTQLGSVTTIKINYADKNTEHLLFLSSDLHVDSVFCNRQVLLEDLEEARRRNAKIFLFGDVFDAMQGRFDPRRSLEELRPEYRRQDYYDFVVKDVARLLAPYAQNILLISPGNHETAVLKNASLSLIDRLVYALNAENGTHIVQGGYGGWVRFLFARGTSGGRTSIKIKYHHGFGGESPVTRGVTHVSRQQEYIDGADIIVNGHNHQSYYVPVVSETVLDTGQLSYHVTHHVRTPGYKQEYNDGAGGWAVERGSVPKPIGGCFIKLNILDHQLRAGGAKSIVCQINVQPAIHAPEVAGV